ncbi:MAG: SH3 domain-containing protein [Deltaproteobacteria bacterium]|nr:SH3 domain-containing protein [Deltaproteobacteria bacterium]
MRTRTWATLVAATLLAAGAAWAVKPGGTLFVKGKDVKVLPKADLGATPMMKLQSGDEVVWNGADAKNKQLHKVKAKGKDGYILQANLTPNKPSDEVLTGDGKPTSAQAFASSGAATKAMSEAGLKYASEKGGKEIAAQVIYVEEHSKKAADAVPDHVKKAGLTPGGGK